MSYIAWARLGSQWKMVCREGTRVTESVLNNANCRSPLAPPAAANFYNFVFPCDDEGAGGRMKLKLCRVSGKVTARDWLVTGTPLVHWHMQLPTVQTMRETVPFYNLQLCPLVLAPLPGYGTGVNASAHHRRVNMASRPFAPSELLISPS